MLQHPIIVVRKRRREPLTMIGGCVQLVMIVVSTMLGVMVIVVFLVLMVLLVLTAFPQLSGSPNI